MLAECETVELAVGDVLCVARERVTHAYFPVRSLISLVMPIDDRPISKLG